MEQEIKSIIGMYSQWTDDDWGQYLLAQDRYYRYFSKEQCNQFIKQATKAGQDQAFRLQAAGAVSPEELAKKYELQVSLGREEDFLMPGAINFAQYHAGSILLSQDYIELMEPLREQYEPLLGQFQVRDLMFYHELFHYLEEQDSDLENAGIRLVIQPLPLFKRTISPESAGEIAAFAFSKAMTGISFHPCLLEMIWRQMAKNI